MDMEEVIAELRRYNYCLMTNDDGVEIYDEKRNLVVCKAESGEYMSIPNTPAFRQLYDLPLDGQEYEERTKGEVLNIEIDSVQIKDNKLIVQDSNYETLDSDEQETPMVWLGQRTPRCQEATKVLIEIFDSLKFQKLMNDRSIIKFKVWEKIALELQDRGFKVADTVKEAGLRTFQKWRNMERTYWRYLRNPEECGEDKRRKKPSFFDDMHAVLSKRNKYSKQSSTNGDAHTTQIEEMELVLENTNGGVDTLPLAQPSTLDRRRLKGGEISSDAVQALLKLIDSDRYKELFNGGGKKTRIWENIYNDMEDMGYYIAGDTKRDKSQKLFQKWRNMKRGFIKYQIEKDLGKRDKKKPFCYDLLFKIISKDLFREKVELTYPSDYLEFSHIDHDYEAIQHPAELYQGATPDISPSVPSPKPVKISKTNTVLPITSSTSSITIPMTTLTKPVTKNSIAPNITTSLDKAESSSISASVTIPISEATLPTFLSNLTTANQTSANSTDILLQIKALHETALTAQEQNFSKVISLLEEQNRLQQSLNSLISQYVTSQPKKHKSEDKNKHKTDESRKELKNSSDKEEVFSMSKTDKTEFNGQGQIDSLGHLGAHFILPSPALHYFP